MKSLLTAIEEGRLIELPEHDKQKSLTLLASLIEAVPSVKSHSNIVEGVLARESQSVTYLGYGWACPHTRTPDEGELICAVGWHPSGISYGNADGQLVKIIALYYVPETQRNLYLKEISGIARCIGANIELQDMSSFSDLNSVRLRLLDIVTESGIKSEHEARARMIRLEIRPAAVTADPSAIFDPALVVPAWIVRDSTGKITVLSGDDGIVKELESLPDGSLCLDKEQVISVKGFSIHVRQTSSFAENRSMFDCIVVKAPKR